MSCVVNIDVRQETNNNPYTGDKEMNKTTLYFAEKRNVFLVEDFLDADKSELAAEILEGVAKGQKTGTTIEVYAGENDCEWYVRYIREGEGYRYAGHISGEDYPAFIANEKAFRDFIDDFSKVYA